jgi:tRNA A-37 threonylcarbamoyl transferase component Bud32
MISPGLDSRLSELLHEKNLTTLEGAFAYTDGEDLHKAGLGRRRRTRIEARDKVDRPWELYLKRYGAPSLWQRIQCRLKGLPRAGEGRREYENIRAIRTAGVPTMREIACDEEQRFLGAGRSYLIVSAVPGDAVERIGDAFLSRHGHDSQMARDFTHQLVQLVRTFHATGYVHRDLYASHVFLHEHDGQLSLYLIDLARAFVPKWRRFRWRVKDLAQLKYSMPWLWVEQNWEEFLRAYLGEHADVEFPRWDVAIERKVGWMQGRRRRRDARAARQEKRGPTA